MSNVDISAHVDIAIIGAGIVGLATALEVVNRFPHISVSVIEKETTVGSHQTGHNSGVIHSGIYYKPRSLKARLCVEGARKLILFCKEHGVPYETCGKLIVATDAKELAKLDELYRRGNENGLRGLCMLTAAEIRDIEPHAAGIRGIHVPSTGIVDYSKVAEKYAELITKRGGAILLSHEVKAIHRAKGITTLETSGRAITAKLTINCAGLQSDRISRMVNAKLNLTIVPFRGEYYEITPEKQHYVKGLIYPVPDPKFPFLGVHFTRHIGNGVEAGPNAVLALKREGYSKKSFDAGDVLEYAMFPGFWIMASKNWARSLGEYHRSLSKTAFLRSLQRLIPEITSKDLIPGGSGVRAQALRMDGKLIDDFHFVYTEGMVHVCNVPSPAATASLAIGEYIVETALKRGDINLTSPRARSQDRNP